MSHFSNLFDLSNHWTPKYLERTSIRGCRPRFHGDAAKIPCFVLHKRKTTEAAVIDFDMNE